MANSRDFYPSQYTVASGKKTYFIDVPDGDCQVSIDCRSNQPHTIYLHVSNDPKALPIVYASGNRQTDGRFNIAGLTGISIETAEKAVIAYKINHRERRMSDPINDYIVSLPVPPPTIGLEQLVSRAIAEKMEALTGETSPQIDLEEILEDEYPDVDSEFGPGAMEMDEEFDSKFRNKSVPQAKPDPVPTAASPAPAPSVRESVEPDKPAKQVDPRLAEIERLLVSLKAGN